MFAKIKGILNEDWWPTSGFERNHRGLLALLQAPLAHLFSLLGVNVDMLHAFCLRMATMASTGAIGRLATIDLLT